MIQRCFNPRNSRYHRYGGRGITVCVAWLTFEGFYADMGDRPNGYSLERKDNDGNYEPENCKWALPKEQMNNTRRNIFIEYEGRRQTIAQWSRETGLNTVTIRARLRRRWPLTQVFNLDTRHTPKLPRQPRQRNTCTVIDCGRACANSLCRRHQGAKRAGRPLVAEILPTRAKLRPADVLSIRAEFDTGKSIKALAERFNISRATISDITRGHTWQHIQGRSLSLAEVQSEREAEVA